MSFDEETFTSKQITTAEKSRMQSWSGQLLVNIMDTRLIVLNNVSSTDTVKVIIEKGEVEGKTVAKVDAQIHQEKRLNAEQLIAADPFIQQLEKEFGAKVVGGSVKPL